MKVVTSTNIPAYPLLNRGKVRDIYEIDEDTLLIVTTDRMSAFDVVLGQPIPYKGVILNQLTLFWMRKFEAIVPNHVLESDVNAFPQALSPWLDELEGRSVICRKARPVPAECIVRGYLAGSGYKSYKKDGEICGQKLQPGLVLADRLDPPLFTPSTKEIAGKHDENICFLTFAALAGDETAKRARLICLDLYASGAAHAAERGIIVADTKFELGYINDELHLIDEVLTPDSSRFWPKAGYKPGQPQPSYDKQYLRDWLDGQSWDHKPPAPSLPEDVIKATAERYMAAYEALTGEKLKLDN